MRHHGVLLVCLVLASLPGAAAADDAGAVVKHLKQCFDAVRAIDTHWHLQPFRHFQETADRDRGFTLRRSTF